MPKIARLNREVIITEKIDGTNAQVFIEHTMTPPGQDETVITSYAVEGGLGWRTMRAGSKSRFLIPGKQDNFGFAHWVKEHSAVLFDLGDGRHLGEWWGSGIQRGYGLEKGEKRFSLFNTGRWYDVHEAHKPAVVDPGSMPAPECCRVVPTLVIGTLAAVGWCIENLREQGSFAAPGFMKPEGVVIFHTAARTMFKVTIEGDEKPKGTQ